MTTTRPAFARSSSAANARPSAGATPSAANRFDDANSPRRFRGSLTPVITSVHCGEMAARCSKELALSRKSL
jgi:hypothetical protein